MAQDVAVNAVDEQTGSTSDNGGSSPAPPRRRVARALIIVAVALVVLVVAAVLVVLLGRDQAEQLSDDQALTEFRAGGAASTETSGRPVAGVYPATASGTESIGLPGFDETFGPNAPVTVTYGDAGCFTYRADFNSFHWRSWTFCPAESATFSLTQLESFTARKAPGLDIATLSTYVCERPLDFLWEGVAVGDTRTGACTGTSDSDDSVTADAGSIEVLEQTSATIGDEPIDVIRLRTTNTFSGAQTGSEVNEWWIDAVTGLPVKVVIDARLTGGPSDYSESAKLELTSLTPST